MWKMLRTKSVGDGELLMPSTDCVAKAIAESGVLRNDTDKHEVIKQDANEKHRIYI